ncbi:hypothetical protein BDQ94DRAFT_148269 [Aspergillus welwitschiae]|uniref:Uncharacterized protein n=1 Tax=Aspergillus welwitschiae TaxID=1341132 RepID=A0A3F3PV80_9EURO|nr:hypothetical protein BDQ94DRAFT_148269 [Aspergillus welwitschiae]RDH30652.1 hypothetical protein BDQ94DRAFT_148269 [Aspergillus welwitschiae]
MGPTGQSAAAALEWGNLRFFAVSPFAFFSPFLLPTFYFLFFFLPSLIYYYNYYFWSHFS